MSSRFDRKICELLLPKKRNSLSPKISTTLFPSLPPPLYFFDSSLLYSTLLYSALLYSTLLYSTLLYSTLLYSTLLYSTLLYSTLLCSNLLYSLSSTPLYSTVLCAPLLFSPLLFCILLCSTLRFLSKIPLFSLFSPPKVGCFSGSIVAAGPMALRSKAPQSHGWAGFNGQKLEVSSNAGCHLTNQDSALVLLQK